MSFKVVESLESDTNEKRPNLLSILSKVLYKSTLEKRKFCYNYILYFLMRFIIFLIAFYY